MCLEDFDVDFRMGRHDGRAEMIHCWYRKSTAALISIISASLMRVMVLNGRLNTAPNQAHWIFRLFKTDCSTPTMLTTNETVLFAAEYRPGSYAMPGVKCWGKRKGVQLFDLEINWG